MVICDHLHKLDVPGVPQVPIHQESRAYRLSWTTGRVHQQADLSGLPALDHAIYLVNSVKFHVGHLFHLFDEKEFMSCLHSFYQDPTELPKTCKIWYIQFLCLIALGKALVVAPMKGSSMLPGSDLFVRAMTLLPDPSYLFTDSLTATETLCIISLYLQAADMRNSAYIYVSVKLPPFTSII